MLVLGTPLVRRIRVQITRLCLKCKFLVTGTFAKAHLVRCAFDEGFHTFVTIFALVNFIYHTKKGHHGVLSYMSIGVGLLAMVLLS